MFTRIYTVNNLANGFISLMPRPSGGDWLDDDIKHLREQGADVLISMLSPTEIRELDLAQEPEICRKHGLAFYHLPITDRGTPLFESATFEFIAQQAAALQAGQHIVVHCRFGIGRSSLLAASILVASGLDPDRAFTLLAEARGCRIPDTPEQLHWVLYYAQHLKGQTP